METLKKIFGKSDFDSRLMENVYNKKGSVLSLSSTKISEDLLGVFSPEEWHKFNKL